MSRALRLALPLLALGAASSLAAGLGASAAQAQGAPPTPVALVRSLQTLQDAIAQGDTAAHLAQRSQLAHIGEQLALAPPAAWKEPRNARAAVAFVLSGGDVRVLRKLASQGALSAIDERLVKGTLAYAEGRSAAAAEHLANLDARTLDASIAGHIALVKSELVAGQDVKKALALLDEARLLAPGTLIEEAALRRQITLAATAKDFDAFDMLATNYMRRFGRSVYAGSFRAQFAADVAGREDAGSAARMDQLATALEAIDPTEARNVLLSLARAAVVRGKVELAQFAADRAGRLVEETGDDGRRLQLYQAAALVVGAGFEQAVAMLESMDGAGFAGFDADLFDAARSVAAEVRRLPPRPEGETPSAETVPPPRVVEAARRKFAHADGILEKASQ